MTLRHFILLLFATAGLASEPTHMVFNFGTFTGKRLPKINVQVTFDSGPMVWEGMAIGKGPFSYQTDTNGSVTISNMAPGRYTVVVQAPNPFSLSVSAPTNAGLVNFTNHTTVAASTPGLVGYSTTAADARFASKATEYANKDLSKAGVLPVPPMSFNPWFSYGDFSGQTNFFAEIYYSNQVNLIYSNKWPFKIIGFDDGWSQASRATNGDLLPNTNRYQNFAALVQHIHDRGMLVEMYFEPGALTAAGNPGLGTTNNRTLYLRQDLTNAINLGVDIVRIDFCKTWVSFAERLSVLRMARTVLDELTNKPVLLKTKAGFNWAEQDVGELLKICDIVGPQLLDPVMANLRSEVWTNYLAYFDYGKKWRGLSKNGHYLFNEKIPTHVVSWGQHMDETKSLAVLLGLQNSVVEYSEITAPDQVEANSFTNADIHAICMDPLCLPGEQIITSQNTNAANVEIWKKSLTGERTLVVFLNRTTNQNFYASVTLKDLGLRPGTYYARDPLNQVDLVNVSGSISGTVTNCTVRAFVLWPQAPVEAIDDDTNPANNLMTATGKKGRRALLEAYTTWYITNANVSATSIINWSLQNTYDGLPAGTLITMTPSAGKMTIQLKGTSLDLPVEFVWDILK